MKKFLAIFLVLTLLFSFAACNKNGNDDENSTNPTEQTDDNGTTNKNEPSSNKEEKPTAPPFNNPNLTVPETLFDVVSVDDYTLRSRDPNTSSSGLTTIAKRYEHKQSKITAIPEKIMVGSTAVVLNHTTLGDVLALGWTIEGKTDENQAIKPGKSSVVFLKNDQNNIVKMDIVNKTSNIVSVKQCVITEVGIIKTMNIDYGWVSVSLENSANTQSSYADVIKALGEPSAINVNEFYQGNDYNYCKATLVYEMKSGNTTYTVSVGYEDKNGTATLDSFIVSAK